MPVHHHRRAEKGQIHVLPLHGIPREVRQRLHPRGDPLSAPGRGGPAGADSGRRSPTGLPAACATVSSRPNRRVSGPPRSSRSADKRFRPGSTAGMRTTWKAGFRTSSGHENLVRGSRNCPPIEAELRRESQPVRDDQLKGEKTLELAKQAGFLYKAQAPAEQRR